MNILSKGINFYTKNKRKLDPHLTFLGAYLTTKFLIRRARAILSTLTMKQVDIAERYGRGSFALVTGGANGIGKQFALDLAKKGFNLIIVDFNQNNLEQTQQELLKIKTDIMVKTILLDFSQGNNPEFFKKFQQEISGMNISILINNVGTIIGGFGHFQRIPIQNVLNSFNVNLTSAIMVTHSVINQMLLRNKYQSLILNLSSAASICPVPFFFGYGAQKVAMANFFDALSLELRGNKNIDILTLTPYFVNTAMIGYDKGLFTIEPQQLVDNTWKYVGKTNKVLPNWKHQFQAFIIRLLPDCLRNKLDIKFYSEMAENVTAIQEN